jgi:hypothetical protein
VRISNAASLPKSRIVKNDICNVPPTEPARYHGNGSPDMRVMHGIDRPTDRDSVVNKKRVVTSGARFADLFRDQYNTFRADVALMERSACDDKATVRRTLQTRPHRRHPTAAGRDPDVPNTMHGAMSHCP